MSSKLPKWTLMLAEFVSLHSKVQAPDGGVGAGRIAGDEQRFRQQHELLWHFVVPSSLDGHRFAIWAYIPAAGLEAGPDKRGPEP